jgi:hypothetical protein
VADRWHLLHHRTDVVERVAAQHARERQDDRVLVAPVPALETVSQQPTPAAGRLVTRSRERYAQVQTLVARGMTITAIADTLHLDRKTVRTFARAGSAETASAPGAPPRGGRSPLLASFLAHVHRRWQEGCTDSRRLLGELRAQGYRGSQRTLARYLTALRRGAPVRPPPHVPTARAIAGLIVRRPERLDGAETALLERVCARCPALASTTRLAQAFATLVRERRGATACRAWLDEAGASGIAPLVSFATGLRRDEVAVVAGVTLPWSSGVVEGHNTRIKVIKRQMDGRAKFDLLRRRVLLAS